MEHFLKTFWASLLHPKKKMSKNIINALLFCIIGKEAERTTEKRIWQTCFIIQEITFQEILSWV